MSRKVYYYCDTEIRIVAQSWWQFLESLTLSRCHTIEVINMISNAPSLLSLQTPTAGCDYYITVTGTIKCQFQCEIHQLKCQSQRKIHRHDPDPEVVPGHSGATRVEGCEQSGGRAPLARSFTPQWWILPPRVPPPNWIHTILNGQGSAADTPAVISLRPPPPGDSAIPVRNPETPGLARCGWHLYFDPGRGGKQH